MIIENHKNVLFCRIYNFQDNKHKFVQKVANVYFYFCLDLSQLVRAYLGMRGPFMACLGLSGPVWPCLALSVLVSAHVWACLGLSGLVWACLSLSGFIWDCLGLFGFFL